MTTDDTMQTVTAPQQAPVCRARRARFIGYVVGFSLITAALFTGLVAGLGVAPIYLPITELYISGMIGLAMATTLAYVGGSVVDYNGGIGNILSSNPTTIKTSGAKG